MIRFRFLLLACVLGSFDLLAQASAWVPINSLGQQDFELEEIKANGLAYEHSALKPLAARPWLAQVQNLNDSNPRLSHLQAVYDFEQAGPRAKKPFLKYFYQNPAHFWQVRDSHFYLNINPILDIRGGVEFSDTAARHGLLLNRRGIRVAGQLHKKVYFESEIIESQAAFPYYVQERIAREQAVPGAGYYKIYNSRLTANEADGVDYLLAQGMIGFQAFEGLGFQFGHGRNFIGDGERSLFLSDFSNNYLHAKINAKFWRIHYQSIFAGLTRDYVRGPDRVLPRKFMAAHYLSLALSKNLQIGFFESVISGRDSTPFELDYLNPFIFYRAVEQGLGSPDNVLIGANWKWIFLKRFSFYGQVVLDEFVFRELFIERQGWWANKYGWQFGLRYVDVFGLPNLNARLEYNTVRPYTYTFRNNTGNHTHYNQALAHPLGANFREFIAVLQYDWQRKWYLELRAQYVKQGLDGVGENWGSNLFVDYGTFQQAYGNVTGQGLDRRLWWWSSRVSYALLPNCFAEFRFIYRRERLENQTVGSRILELGLRYNLEDRPHNW